MILKTKIITYMTVLMLMASTAMSKIIYVDIDTTGANNGSNWSDAYVYLQDALADANSSEKPVEIRVAKGIYKPDEGTGLIPDDREATFQLISGTTLKGGYAGFSESDPNVRDIELYETILSGDLNSNDVDVNNRLDLFEDVTRYDNSYHVLAAIETDETLVLDGFRVLGGYCLKPPPMVFDPPAYYGGGMVIIAANPTVVNCTFTDNAVTVGGGAIAIFEKSRPTFVNCKFERNYSSGGGGIHGIESVLTLIDCLFINNTASKGAGIYCKASNCRLNNCIFGENTAFYLWKDKECSVNKLYFMEWGR